MDTITTAAYHLLKNPAGFSEFVIGLPLYQYQLAPLLAIAQSIIQQSGLEFILIFPRQSGKNEAIAQLLVYTLNLFQRKTGTIVYGATGDGIGRGISRLEERLDNPWNRNAWRKKARPQRRILGRAEVAFLSTHPTAATRGATANWLLIVDEMQDQDRAHLEAVFEPMRAATNATAVYIGTTKTTSDALWMKKNELEALEAQDKKRRVYVTHPSAITAENEAYKLFLEGKVKRFGRYHPIIASEYYNEPLAGSGGLFDDRRRALMTGTHTRQLAPDPQKQYVATIDVAGQDEAATDELILERPERDWTVTTIHEVDTTEKQPRYLAVDAFRDHGSRHFQDNAEGRPSLAEQILQYLTHWTVSHIVIDASGAGEGLSDWLASELPGRLTPVKFTSRTKATIGNSFLSLIETGRFHYWQGEEYGTAWLFMQQARFCSYSVPEDGQLETHLRWYVPDTQTIDTPEGTQLLHDDLLLSAALITIIDDEYKQGKLNLGTAASAIIRPFDPLSELTW